MKGRGNSVVEGCVCAGDEGLNVGWAVEIMYCKTINSADHGLLVAINIKDVFKETQVVKIY